MAIMIRSNAEAGSFITTYPGSLILIFGIPFVFALIFCVLAYCGFFACVMGNGITHYFRRARARREDSRSRRRAHCERQRLMRLEREYEREQNKNRRRERQEREKAQKHAGRYQGHAVTVPETAHVLGSSSINFNGSRRPTHGSSAPLASGDSLHNPPANIVSGTRSQIEAWNIDVERGLPPDNVSLHTRASSQGRSRLQKRNGGHSADVLSRGSSSLLSQHLGDRHVGSIGGSSLLFDERGSIDQRPTSALGLLRERH